jgi:hypothetical protein
MQAMCTNRNWKLGVGYLFFMFDECVDLQIISISRYCYRSIAISAENINAGIVISLEG